MNVTHRLRAAAAVAVLAPVLSSCGFNYATDEVYTPGVGVNERSGTVDVLHALVVSGEEGTGTVIAGLVNNDRRNPDTLTEVTGAGEDQGITVEITGEQPQIPADGFVQLADEGSIHASGDQIRPGQFVTLRFSFENAESVTLDVPVVARDGEFADVPVPSAS